MIDAERIDEFIDQGLARHEKMLKTPQYLSDEDYRRVTETRMEFMQLAQVRRLEEVLQVISATLEGVESRMQ